MNEQEAFANSSLKKKTWKKIFSNVTKSERLFSVNQILFLNNRLTFLSEDKLFDGEYQVDNDDISTQSAYDYDTDSSMDSMPWRYVYQSTCPNITSLPLFSIGNWHQMRSASLERKRQKRKGEVSWWKINDEVGIPIIFYFDLSWDLHIGNW